MDANRESKILHLERGQFVRLATGEGFDLRSDSGALWLTIDGERRDTILGAGDGLTREGCRRVLVEALEASTLSWAPSSKALPVPARCNGQPRAWRSVLSGFLNAVTIGAQRPHAMA